MSTRFTDYDEAARFARAQATQYKVDMALRAQTEFGTYGYNVSFADRNSNDYEVAEIVKPNEPQSVKTEYARMQELVQMSGRVVKGPPGEDPLEHKTVSGRTPSQPELQNVPAQPRRRIGGLGIVALLVAAGGTGALLPVPPARVRPCPRCGEPWHSGVECAE